MSLYKHILFSTFFFLYTFSYGQQIRKEETLYTSKQNKIGGTYVTGIDTENGISYYYESISFKYGTDSFFYWCHPKNILMPKGYGKGTYKIENKKLYLIFENTGIIKPFNTSYTTTSIKENRIDTQIKKIIIKSLDSSGQIIFDSHILKNNQNIYVEPINLPDSLRLNNDHRLPFKFSEYELKNTDFPITITGIALGYKPIVFKIDNPGNYDINIYYHYYTNSLLCNGEKWEYNILSYSGLKIELQLSGEFPSAFPQTFFFASFQKAGDNQEESVILK